MHLEHPMLDPIKKMYRSHRLEGKSFCLAIDGRSAAGKSTLAALLEEELHAGIIHMDDFYLPLALRTEERFQEPGGNVHWERFLKEVAPYLEHKKEQNNFQYRIFDCRIMDYKGLRCVRGSDFIVVEGAYSLRPELRHLYDAALFMDIDPPLQKQRIQRRNGKEIWENFRTRWIPLEEAYHEFHKTKQSCQLYWKALPL